MVAEIPARPRGKLVAMTLASILERYYRLEALELFGKPLHTKPGVRGFPEVPPGAALFGKVEAEGAVTDASGTAGAAALAFDGPRVVLEGSRAALTCLRKTFAAADALTVAAGAPWDAPPDSADTLCLTPMTDRGNARVEAELKGAHTALRAGGSLYLVLHKDQGAKRYEKLAKTLFGELSVLAKGGGWRLSRALKRSEAATKVSTVRFEAGGLQLEAEPGVYAAGKVDPGTAQLLGAFEVGSLAGKRVLDLGCGYGLLALKAALVGAEVTALDDDLTAVRSTYRNAKTYGLDIRCLHSDVVSELSAEARFDVVVMNPPFHVGKAVRLELPRAFIAAAHKHLVPGGELVLVANKALQYEALLNHFAYWETLAADKAFKVLRAIR